MAMKDQLPNRIAARPIREFTATVYATLMLEPRDESAV
jgi:hypothetical protein